MHFTNVFHTGILVSDLDAAIAFYEKTLGVSFLAPLDSYYPRVQQSDSDMPCSARMTYSRTGPVHLELLEADGPGLWQPRTDHQFHHLGLWAPDPSAMARELVAEGFTWEASCYTTEGTVPVVFVRRADVRLELVDESRRPRWTDWVAGRIASPR